MPTPPALPHAGAQPPDRTGVTGPETAADTVLAAGHGRLNAAEAMVVIAITGAVTALSIAQRPVPAVLLGLCAAAGTLLIRLPVACLLGRCGGGQG
ncbi:hypothetical protein [Streptomyces acidiscabies]|uniref:hypothetical protein n=1 Tax=Streptomyces acidiscabies TaxID=42234 RepID=UPI0009532439|nr:hypothetical protein [Streptomyces acidiscabies]